MAMEIAKTFVVNATPEAVWSFLVDLPRVARCLPGAAIGERLDEKTSSGTMTIKVGPVSSTYRGKVVFERLDAAARTAELVATGQDVRGKGGADLRLTSSVKALPGGKTEVTAVSLVNVTGILAQMGRGMIQDVSDEMFQIFSERMRAELESGAPGSPTDAAAAGAPPQVSAHAPDGEVPRGAGAASSPRPDVSAAGRSASAPPAAPEALDAAVLGARVARRSASRWARQPAFWVVVLAVLGAVLYLSLHRSS
jgi:carbon monoxide dehydrogenase subunit G